MNADQQSDSTVRENRHHDSPVQQLRSLWNTERPLALEAVVASLPGPSPHELAALIVVDLEARWERADQPTAEVYLDRFPAVASHPESAVDVIYAEYLAREKAGQQPQLAEFRQRFPEFAEVLSEQVRLHQAFADLDQGENVADDAVIHGDDSKHADYEILDQIGSGGMGVVYKARQVALHRLVALKMIRAIDADNADLIARFRSEARLVASLHHPHIVQVYDFGEHDGRPYIAMELIEGGSLADRLTGSPWDPKSAASLVRQLAAAVQYAHEHNVIHRDLKPANVLIVSSGEAVHGKVTDFGLAKLHAEQSLSHNTKSFTFLGTPSYMSPEQAAGHTRQIGPAADVYALGAILYELLTGRPPFRGETPIATLQQVLTGEPVAIRQVVPRVPRDLATICSKCLMREPALRYPSAADLSDDLARQLADQPIRARPANTSERAWRWCRRNPALALLGGAVVLSLAAVAVVSTVASLRLSAQLQKTAHAEAAERKAKGEAQVRLWDSYLAEVTARTANRKLGQRIESLATVDKATALLSELGPAPQRLLPLRNAAIAALARPDVSRLQPSNLWSVSAKQASFCSAADRCAVLTPQGKLVVLRMSDGTLLHSIAVSGIEGRTGISPDGRFVVLYQDGTRVWRVDGVAPELVWEEANSSFFTFAPDCRHAAVSNAKGTMRLLDLETGRELRRLGREAGYSRFAFHLPTRRIAVLGESGFLVISWDTGEVLRELPLPGSVHHSGDHCCVAWHPSGDYLLVGPYTAGMVLMHVATAEHTMVYPHRSQDMTVQFLGDGELLCTYGVPDGSLHLWHTGTGTELLGDVTFNDFAWDQSPASRKLFRWGDASLETWEVAAATEYTVLPQGIQSPLATAQSLDISPDGRLLAISRSKGVEFWDLVSQRHWFEAGIHNSLIKFTQNGDLIVSGNSSVTRWPRKTQSTTSGTVSELSISYGPPQQLAGPSDDFVFAIDPPGRMLAVEPPWNGGRVIHIDQANQVVRLPMGSPPKRMAISSDGQWVAVTHAFSSGATVFNATTGRRVANLSIGGDGLPLFSSDNRWLATSSESVRLWRVGDWQLATELRTQRKTRSAQEIAFSPDSRVLAVGQPNGAIRLVDPTTGNDWATLIDPEGSPSAFLAFSPDQSKLIALAAGENSAPRIWNLAAIRRGLAKRGLDWPQDVLRPLAEVPAIADATRLQVAIELGSFLRKEAAVDLISRAAGASAETALELNQQAAQMDPESALAHSNIAWVLATGPQQLRDPAGALLHARRAVSLEPVHQGYLNTLGIALCRNAMYDEAIQVLNRSLDLSVNDGVSFDLLFLALAYTGKGDVTTARIYFTRAKDWFDTRGSQMPNHRREEFTRLLDESRPNIPPCDFGFGDGPGLPDRAQPQLPGV